DVLATSGRAGPAPRRPRAPRHGAGGPPAAAAPGGRGRGGGGGRGRGGPGAGGRRGAGAARAAGRRAAAAAPTPRPRPRAARPTPWTRLASTGVTASASREDPMRLAHAWLALQAVTSREVAKFLRQGGRLASALVRPLLWLVVFAAGFQNVFGVSIIPPYDTYIPYQTYIVPGLLGMALLFNGMQSSLAMVYDREMGVMRLLLTRSEERGVGRGR